LGTAWLVSAKNHTYVVARTYVDLA
jgi:hypothetical protein